MGLFVSSKAQANRRAVYATERTPPAIVKPTGFGTAAIIEQFAWGPKQALTFPSNMAAFLNMIAPPGMDRTTSGYLAVIRKGFPRLGFVRVHGSTSVAASAAINKTGPTLLFTLTLKYPGVAGNSVVVTTSAASDGDANHFNITVSVTGASGTTTDLIENVNLSGVGTQSVPTQADIDRLVLVGSITVATTGVPIMGSTTCTGGTEGTITAADYVGTQGANDKGVAKLEGNRTIDHFFAGDPGNSFRATVNAGLRAHADYMSDRVAYINGNSGLTAAAAQSDVASYRSQRVVYTDPWVYLYDDVDGTKRLVPGAPFAASVASQVSPSTPISWKDPEVQTMLNGIVDLEADRGEGTSTNTDAGIATFIREDEGGFTIEADVLTIAPSQPAKQDLTRTRMGHYMARSMTKSLRPLNDAPSVPENQQDVVDAITSFMEILKGNAKNDANHTPHVLDYGIADIQANNPQGELDQGDFSVPIDTKTSTGMKRIFLNFNYGPTVQVLSS